MTSWTDGMYDRMRVLIGEGCSASAVSRTLNAEFGGYVSRNAVIGKAHRHRIEFTNQRGGQTGSHRPRPRKVTPNPGRMMIFGGTPQPAEPMPVMAEAKTAAYPVTLHELTPFTCRWPLGDTLTPAKLFCGAGCPYDEPYCAAHSRRAYR